MTQKEKLFREWYGIKNEVSRLRGEIIMNVDLAVRRHNLSSFKVKELEQLVEIEKRHCEFTDNLCSIDGEIDEVENKLGKPLEHLKNDD